MLPGFEPGASIGPGPRVRLQRARRDDGLAVLLELGKPGHDLARLQRDFELGRGFDHPHVLRYLGFEQHGETAAVVLEDLGGVTLAEWIRPGGLPLPRFTDLAQQLARALSAVHAAGLVHKDVEPGNVLLDPGGERLALFGFGVAARLDDGEQLRVAADRIEGTLAYISPEQTGRMNRRLDHRADLYSLGVSLYELLCGQLPFTATEPLELVHCHLAKLPEPPARVRPDVPEQLSRVVMKLLAKAPEDRYQSAEALAGDLRRCHDALLAGVTPPLFELDDTHAPTLRVPARLFGRERDLGLLEQAWTRARAGQPTVVVVSGGSGVGKSALVGEFEQRLSERPGAFLRGKFGQLGPNAAYEGFAEAFRALAGRILGASMDEFEGWQQRLGEALAGHGRLLLDVIPELEPIVGPLASVTGLGLDESQHRFHQVLRRFVRACARADHPLTLFLDDVQWADPGSLALLELLTGDDEQGSLLVIVAVRDDELDAHHPTQQCLDQLRTHAARAVDLRLASLRVADIEALLVEALGASTTDTRPLAELVVERTSGNPLFVRTFLQTAWDEGLLTAQRREPGGLAGERDPAIAWRWDELGLRHMHASESVGELLARRIRQLPATTRATLRTAACFGASFNLETVAAITGTTPEATLADLYTAADAGMILVRHDERWEFVHDRVREASHALLPPDDRAATHLRIGEMLLATTPADRLNERIFAIVDQLEAGRTRIRDANQLALLAQLAEIAGLRAQNATAYATAVRYFRVGLDCLARLDELGSPLSLDPPPSPPLVRAWREHYDLTLGLHRHLAVAEHLGDDPELALGRITTALAHARDAVDQVELFGLLVFQHTMATRYEQALALGREALALLDIRLPEDPEAIDAAIATASAEQRERLGERPIAALVELPPMTRRDNRAAARLLATLVSAAYSAEPRLFPLVALELVNLSLAHGTVPESSYGFAHHGTYVGAVLGDHEAAYAWGELALALARRDGDLAQEARACNIVAGFLLPWSAHVSACDPLNDRGEEAAIETGQREFVGYIHYHRQLLHLFAGAPLDQLARDLDQALVQLRAIHHTYAANVVRGLQPTVARLRGDGPDLAAGPDDPREAEFLAACAASRSAIAVCVHHLYRALLDLVHGQPEAALADIVAADVHLPFAIGHVALADRSCVRALALAATFEASPERERALAEIDVELARLHGWARSCPANFEPRALLVAGERARCAGDPLAAVDLLERAIAAARAHGFVQLEALASERAARLWLARGNRRLAQPYLSDAVAAYRRWGARAKLDQLAAELPELSPLPAARQRSELVVALGSSQALDLATVARASQAISSEIDLDRLLARMMRIILLNAGANRGYLILGSDAEFRIAVAASSEEEAIEFHRPPALAEAELPVAIVRHVLRSGEDVVLEDAHRRGPFTDDPHVARHRLRSVLCTPIRHKDELVGVLYLENVHASAAFTETRIEILQILLSQAAISLENVRYYDELKSLNHELRARADELAESKARLEAEIAERERGQVERIELEAQLRQSQKMEAIGQLAGGVAHDFNNLLTTILGSSDVLTTRMRLDGRASPDARLASGADEVRVIREAAERGAALTRQLLAFSRRQVLQPELVDLNSLVARSGSILERLLGAEYRLHFELGDDLGQVRVDPGQLEQVILNLVINARDASEPGGQVWLSTRRECVDSPRAAQPQVVLPGDWVVLCVRDNGAGIDSQTIGHIFEPFFTTKGVGEGTGLGLSTVLGIVQQSDGCVTVDSQLGVGTTFEIWLPHMTEPNDTPSRAAEEPEPELESGSATILVVEDEAPVRRTVEQILLLHGYAVLTAEDGAACLELCARHQGPIDLVLTDFVMPRLGGLDLAAKLRVVQPHTKILFMSGFTDGQLDPAKVAALGGIELIEKPFRAAALLERIRGLLDA